MLARLPVMLKIMRGWAARLHMHTLYPILQKLVRRHPYTHAHCLNFEIALRFGKNFREVRFEELASDCSSIVLTY